MEKITVESVLNRIQERHGLKSDYAISKMTGLSAQVINNWRKGRSHPDEKMCGILAEAAGIDPLVLAASMQAQRSKTDEARTLWQAIAERLQMGAHGLAAAIFSVLFATCFVATDARAESVSAHQAQTPPGVSSLYIVSSWLRALAGRCGLWFHAAFFPPHAAES